MNPRAHIGDDKSPAAKILVASGGACSLTGFRLPLIKCLVARGFEVVATACEHDEFVAATLAKHGVRFVPFSVGRASVNPLADICFVLRLLAFFRRERFDFAFLFQQKAVLYGGIAARLAGIPKIFAMVTGLGYAFDPRCGIKYKVVHFVASILYKVATRGFSGMIFQNPDDMEFIRSRFLKKSSLPLKRVFGSGVDLNQFPYSEKFGGGSFIFVGRLIADKGIREYVEAGGLLRRAGKAAKLFVAGGFDNNPSAITEATVREWERRGDCVYMGKISNVREALAGAAVFVLPSHGEGTPRAALEAMATGRPIITTNSPGCREVVFFEKICRRFDRATKVFVDLPAATNPRDFVGDILLGDNGFLVPVKDPESLSLAMAYYLEHPEAVKRHGRESRRLAEKFYDVNKVNQEILGFMGVA
ncbi:MAG: glycosyltransferase family 4 protein [Opitutae bacterium]|nr:glycosyltransferase family 4 protein [Opitutae bacterium]